MHDSLMILGRQPALGLAELESLYGADKLRPAGNEAALITLEPHMIDFARLGGSVKLCKVFGAIGTTKWPEIQKHLEQKLPQLAGNMPEGKITLGLSAYGLGVRPQQLLAAGLTVKKMLRGNGRPVRLVPNQTAALNSAQVLHNRLTNENGCELVLVQNGPQTIIAQTIAEQDIESYTLRDRDRPKRDARVGMLPPKLAQIIINLAIADRLAGETTLLDPFCGTGVLLQEATMMGFDIYGTDLEPRMIAYTRENLAWLQATGQAPNLDNPPLEVAEATSYIWETPFDAVACETYLGQPFSMLPSPEKLEQVRATCNIIVEKFLTNIGNQIQPGARLCLAVPAWQQKPGHFVRLPLLDHLAKLRYNRVSFEHARSQELIYSRDDQIVARELLVLKKS
jgi:tRNA (guanine10-N2)-dimethyltransferase